MIVVTLETLENKLKNEFVENVVIIIPVENQICI